LFVYGAKDIRPSWPVEQIAALLPRAKFISISGASHYIWFTHSQPLKEHLTEFIAAIERGTYTAEP
jgi:proline iminopeptidase